jgi:RNA polymerase sigma-70 factor (ECF subfamily)
LDEFQTGLVELLPRLRRFAKILRPADADAQDLVQQTVERALACRTGFRSGTRLDSWTFTLMRRIAIDEGRKTQRWGRVLTSDDEGAARTPDPAEADEALRADGLAARRALHALPDDQRHAVALVLIEGLSYAEAAQVLGVPAGTLTSRLVRGRQSLIKTLAAEGVTG